LTGKGFFRLSCAVALGLTLNVSDLYAGEHNWTWMKGSDLRDQEAEYGMLLYEQASNDPGARTSFASWTGDDGILYMYGGDASYDENYYGLKGDMWKYDPSSNNWIWIEGSCSYYSYPEFGMIEVADSANTPGGRAPSSWWKDSAGDFWMFGGSGYDASGHYGKQKDMWRYNPDSNTWAWIKGPGVYNQFGI
jgi:N-acetylneuraminic acid mutarotase